MKDSTLLHVSVVEFRLEARALPGHRRVGVGHIKERRKGKAKQGKARQEKTRQDKTTQATHNTRKKARQHKTRQHKTRYKGKERQKETQTRV